MANLNYFDVDELVGVGNDDGDYSKYNFEQEHEITGNFVNDIVFYFNILWYLIFCTYVAVVRFPDNDYVTTRDFCIEGAYYEFQYASTLAY